MPGYGAHTTILVGAAIWRRRGRCLNHPASDRGHEELHAFAALLGLPRASFHGHHHDVTDDVRSRAVQLGARPVAASELVGPAARRGLWRPADRLTRRAGRSSPSA